MRVIIFTMSLILYVGQAFAFESKSCSSSDGSFRYESQPVIGKENIQKWIIYQMDFKASEIVSENVKDTYRLLEEKHNDMTGHQTFIKQITLKYADPDIGNITASPWIVCTFSSGL